MQINLSICINIYCSYLPHQLLFLSVREISSLIKDTSNDTKSYRAVTMVHFNCLACYQISVYSKGER